MKITVKRVKQTTLTIDVDKIASISGINNGTNSFILFTTDGIEHEIVASEYNNLLAVIGTAGGGGGSSEYQGMPVIETTERVLTLEPNKYYIFGECTTLDITLGEPISDGKLNEYRFEFESGAIPTVLTLPNTVSPSSINIQPNTKYVISIKNNVLTEVGTQYDSSQDLLRNIINKTIVNLVVPNECQVIPQYMFYNCNRLASITLSNTLSSIEQYAFSNCTTLQSIELPNTLTLIGNNAFTGCSNLQSIIIPEGVKTIKSNCFQNCRALASVTFPEGLTSIDSSQAFASCQSIRELNFPSTLTYIGTRAFEYCYSLDSIVIPQNVTVVGDYSFQYCTNARSITLPDNLTTINQVTFGDCRSVSPTVVLPSRLVNIGTSAFLRCYGLSYIEIPQSVTTINNTAFQNCTGLDDIKMYDGITTIGGTNAFQGIRSTAKVRIIGTTRVIPFMSGLPAQVRIYVDDSMVQTYKTSSAWSARASYIYSLNDYT